ncbi:ATP-binding protein [bacterium]|nr:ATP-binding protein [bacterium]
MSFNISYKRKLFIYYFAVFFVFLATFIVYQYSREKQFRALQLENNLNAITDVTHKFVDQNDVIGTQQFYLLDSLMNILPTEDTRVTLIDNKGKVLFDSFVEDYSSMENHLDRPEVQKAKFSDEHKGSNIRLSSTTGQDFYYYAHSFNNYYIRAAVVYNVEVKNFLKAERLFLLFVAFIFIVSWFTLSIVTNKLSESITKLKDFAIHLRQNKPLTEDIQFPKNELGVISKQIVSMYKKVAETKNALSVEKEKLIKHLFVLNEGVGFFSPDKKSILTNSHFVQFLNLIAEKSSIHPEHIFEIDDLKELQAFIDKWIGNSAENINSNSLPQTEFTLLKGGSYFSIKCIVFQDKSFEIFINDISKLEKRRLLKQQMTSNIAHELRTPVASVMGFLETVLNNKDIEAEKKDYFIGKAFKQSTRLSELIDDIVVLNKIEEAGENFDFDKLNISELIAEVIENRQSLIAEQKTEIKFDVDATVLVNGNRSLVISIFQNLVDNAIKYAGENTKLSIEMYHQDKKFYYFAISDNGIGIPEEHLARIFERFYRVDSGRSRKLGGTGLGLAIVKHAVNIHKGEVSVKNGVEGGAEFYFSLPKYIG